MANEPYRPEGFTIPRAKAMRRAQEIALSVTATKADLQQAATEADIRTTRSSEGKPRKSDIRTSIHETTGTPENLTTLNTEE